MQPYRAVEADGGDDESESVQKAEIHDRRALARARVAAAWVVEGKGMCDGSRGGVVGLQAYVGGCGGLGDGEAEGAWEEEGQSPAR